MAVWLCTPCAKAKLGEKFEEKTIGGVGPCTCATCGVTKDRFDGMNLVSLHTPKSEWHEVDEDVAVKFEYGCIGEPRTERGIVRRWERVFLKCNGIGMHGHVSIATAEDGTCWLPFPLFSQEGVRRYLADESRSWMRDVERQAILNLTPVQGLQEALTDVEREIFDNPERRNLFSGGMFIS